MACGRGLPRSARPPRARGCGRGKGSRAVEESFVDAVLGQLSGVAVTVWRPRTTVKTTGTLSTLPSLSSRPAPWRAGPDPPAAAAAPGALGAGNLRTIPLDPDH